MAREATQSGSGPMDRLKTEARSLMGALGDRTMASVRGKVQDATGRLTEYVEGGGGPGIMAALTGARNLAEGKSPSRSMFGAGMAGLKEKITGIFRRGGKGGGSRKLKLTNIIESVDVGVPLKVAYNQWTQYSDFPKFTKKVESADQNKNEENKTNWKAQVFWSHRTWEATVLEQVPDERIIWRSKGQKGHVDGTVSFHELTPNLTRILLVLEYHPQGLFERTGNLWRAQGRRARLELKHFRRHIMTEGLLHADDLEGWRGTIHDGEVVESHEDAVEREEKEGAQDESQQSRQSGNGRVEGAAQDQTDEDTDQDQTDEDTGWDQTDEDGGRDEADERAAVAADGDGDRASREDEKRATRNGRATRSGERSGERSGTRRGAPPRERRAAGTGSERRRRTGTAAQRRGDR